MKKFFLLILLSCITFLAFSQETEITTITILRARQTSYKKAEDTGNDTIELEGSVILSVQKGNTTTAINADKITYDRKTEMLYAEGNVEIETKSSSSGGEKTTANTLLMNTSTLEGIFDGGRVIQTKSDALNLPSGSTLIVFSELFGKSSDNVIAFKNSSLTFCDAEIPHWHIDATRTWLLPGGEFAFFNALLYVGVIPVLYFPAFYYPKDELIFNPVFSFKKREGTSIQTTTYLWGRKPLSPESSTSSSSSTSTDGDSASSTSESLKALYNFVRPATLKEQKLEGIVLHNLDEDYTGDTTQYVKFLADWYSNLGFFTGVDANFTPKESFISKFGANFNLAFSKTLFNRNGEYYPFSQNGITFYDRSSFLGFELPFRYSGKIDFSISKPFSFSLNMPFYSDPYYSYDFITNRVETMDWISYFLNSQNGQNDTSVSEISTFSWQLSSSYSPKIPDIINPYISSVSFRLNSSVNFTSKNIEQRKVTFTDENGIERTEYQQSLIYKDKDNISLNETPENVNDYSQWRANTPNKRFYYPSSITPATLDFSLNGTLFSWPLPKKVKSTSQTNYSISLNKPDELKTEKQILEDKKKEEEEKRKKEEDNDKEKTDDESLVENESLPDETEEEKYFTYNIPDLNYSTTLLSVSEGITYKLAYNLGANLTSQLSYASKQLYTADDFDWKNIRSYMYTLKIPASITSNFNYGGNFFTMNNSFSFSPIFQEHPYLLKDEVTGGYSESEINSLLTADYNAENRDFVNSNTITLKPFTYMPMFSDSNLSWSSTYKLYRRKFSGTAQEPEWEILPFDFDDENAVTTNTLAATVSASQLSNLFKQNLTLQVVMPPLPRQFTTTLGLYFPYVSTSISTGFQEIKNSTTDTTILDADKWKKSPINQSLSINLFNSKLSLSQSFTYNLEDEHNENLKFSASCFGLQVSYTMSYTNGYELDREKGWISNVDKDFLPYSLNFSYSMPNKTYYTWFNRITFAPGLSTSITADLLKPTNSSFVFSPSIKFKISDFFDITFSSTSKNSILYWYFNEGLYDEGQFPMNMFNDLIDSFRFDERSKREGSGFKLNSLNMSITHELHDWRFSMTAKMEPRLLYKEGKPYYDFNPYITIGVVWNPMESIKTSIVDDYGEWKLE